MLKFSATPLPLSARKVENRVPPLSLLHFEFPLSTPQRPAPRVAALFPLAFPVNLLSRADLARLPGVGIEPIRFPSFQPVLPGSTSWRRCEHACLGSRRATGSGRHSLKSIYQPTFASAPKGVLQLPVPRDKISTRLPACRSRPRFCGSSLLHTARHDNRTAFLLTEALCYFVAVCLPALRKHSPASESPTHLIPGSCRIPSSRRGLCRSPYRRICASVARYQDSPSCRPFRRRVWSRIRLPHAQPTTNELAT